MHPRASFSLSSSFALCLFVAACGGSTTSDPTSTNPTPAPTPSENLPPGDSSNPGPTAAPRKPEKIGDPAPPENVAIPFTIFASNQSFDLDPVDIDLYIDGKHVVTGDFEVGSQHSWFKFDFQVATGEHTLRAVSKKGTSDTTATFKLNGTQRWAVVDFWYYATAQGGATPTPQHFGIDFYDEEPHFQ